MSSLARRRYRDTNTWPGFVDALATLLMVIMFVLMIFIVAQFYLTQILSGKDETLARLTAQVSELTDLLALEREESEELRITVSQLSAELQIAVGDREELAQQVSRLKGSQDALESRLAAVMAEKAMLQQRLDSQDASRSGIDARMLEVLEERDALLGKLAKIESESRIAKAEQAQLTANLEDALKVIDANRETIELQVRDLERLRRDLASLREVRGKLESEVAALLQAKGVLERDLSDRERALVENEDERRELEERVIVLLGDLEKSKLQIQVGRESMEVVRNQALDMAERLGAERDRTKALEAQLAEQVERTQLAQKELDARDIRLEELFTEYRAQEETLTAEQKISAEARRQVELLNAQVAALRLQLAKIEAALEVSELKSKEQGAQILDLGKRLNAALATKVQELAKFRSEFFGRLREVLADRKDVRVVADRFVFQSEVLFDSGSADIGIRGELKLIKLAETLREISATFPDEINWILQVEGHTDAVPINTPRFKDNWALSTARARSVVDILIAEGIPPHRLSATGYGEFQPIDPLDLNRNRRIELKLTQR